MGFNQIIKKCATLLLLLIVAGLFSGCETMSYGAGDFSCKGRPDGSNCASAKKTYERTNGLDPLIPYQEEKNGNSRGASAGKKGAAGEEGAGDVDVYVTESVLPAYDHPYPVRTPARVMRVWIGPYEDEAGNLHDGRFVFSEVQTRQWTIGEPSPATPDMFYPLQSDATYADPESPKKKRPLK